MIFLFVVRRERPPCLSENSVFLSFRRVRQLTDDEESRTASKTLRGRFLAALSRKSVILSEAKNLH
jgi:hypothetical protein